MDGIGGHFYRGSRNSAGEDGVGRDTIHEVRESRKRIKFGEIGNGEDSEFS